MNEGFRATTAQDLIKMYDLDKLVKDRQQSKEQNKQINEEIKNVSALVKDFADTINGQIKELEDQVDGKISTWFFSGIPSATTEPEVNWATDEEKSKHVGDIYYDQETGNSYTYMYEDNSYKWVASAAGDVSEVLAIANKAQDTADRKRQIFVVQPYPPYEVGDMWLKDDKDIYRCRAKRDGGEFSEVDWIPASDYTNDDYAKGVEAQLDVFKEVVETDYVLKTAFETSNEGIRSEVSSLTTIVEKVNVDVQELTETVDMFSVEMAQNTIVIPTDNNKCPTASTIFEIPFYGYFKGKQVIPNVSIKGNYTGITASNTTSVIKFSVQSGVAIDQLSNSYEITYSYYYDGYNYVTTKNVTITLAPKGSDGTSVNILGSYDSYEALKQAHPTGNIGDAYIINGDMYVWNKEEQDWVDVGDIQGPAGSPGKDGSNGKSAYQIWLDNGNVGTEEDYLASLKGEDGYTPIKNVDYFDGDNGKSAYQLWLDAGNTGSVEDYQASLKGEKGDKGNDATTYYTWLKYADTPTSGISDNPANKKYMGIAYNKTTPTESNNYNDYAWSLIKGADGQDGITPIKGVDYFDGYTPVKGKDYFDGQPGDDGVSIVSVTNLYAKNTSATTAPTSGWNTNRPTRNKNEFLWVKELIKFSNNGEQETTPFVVTGDTGDKGDDGYTPVKGKDYFDGANGKDGTSVAITSTSVTYQAGSSGTTKPTGTWQTSVPSVSNGQYLWTKTVVNYSDGKSTESYSVAYKGTNGTNGSNGTSYYTHIRYSNNSNGSSMSSDPSGKSYIGIYSGTSSTAPTSYTSYTWSKFRGDDGSDGTDGKDGNGINSITYYYATTTTQSTPSASSITSTTIPTLTATNKYLWQKEVIDFTDSTVADKTTILLLAVYGDKGNDGYTPVKGKDYFDGEDGYTPVKGVDYFDGYTPIKGVDYFDGEPGKDGTNGVSTYFYVRYSANSNGSSMTTTPQSNTKYMGTASTTSPTAPTSTSAYTWVEIRGKDGQNGSPGQAGANGLTSYIHIKYSDDGTTFTEADDMYGLGERPSAWIGQLVDYIEADSTNFDDYTWYKFTEDIDETLNELQNNVNQNKIDIENTKQDIYKELDNKASVENVTTVLNEVKTLQTATSQTLTIVEDIQVNGVSQVKTENNFTFNKQGLTLEETGAKTKSILNNKGVDVVDTQGTKKDVLYAGYVDETKADESEKLAPYKGQSVVYTENMVVDTYLVTGTHSRQENYEDGTGMFYIGG